MVCNKGKEAEQETQALRQHCLECRACGSIVKSEACSWQEDEDGEIWCLDCRAERESCGCSD